MKTTEVWKYFRRKILFALKHLCWNFKICFRTKNLNAKTRRHKEINKLSSLRETIKSHAEAQRKKTRKGRKVFWKINPFERL
jgi:hypothetical protein